MSAAPCYLLGSMKRVAIGAAAALGLGLAAWWVLRGPSAEEILASLDVPAAPARSPAGELATFRVADGFRVELVAAEPLVVAPVAVDWDDAGRLHVVEMRGFMPNLAGEGEDAPSGSVVVLEDGDGDGVMDRRHVLLDGLVLPRAVAVLPDGVLVGAPPDLWWCPPFEEQPVCRAPRRLAPYARGTRDPEHAENGLVPAIDGWLYNAKSERRFRFEAGVFREERTGFRGQWGIAQDDEGRLYTNHNSAFLFVDLFPAEYLTRHPATDPRVRRPGLAEALASDATVHGVRVAPGLNRAYLDGVLRPDGRQLGPTAVSGVAVNRADALGADARGDAFVPEPAGNVVARFHVRIDGLSASAEQVLSPDPDWGEREFLASSDERFRPVNVAFGPDGALTVVDMYRGVIQHASYVSEHLRAYATKQGLERPLERGRIWRVVRDGVPRAAVPELARADTAELVALLEHPNGWVRDRAQRRLARDPAAAPLLRELTRFGPAGRRHALWTLAALGALDAATWREGLADADPAVRRAALRTGDRLLREAPSPERIDAVLAATRDADAAVRLQALHSLGEAPAPLRPLAALLAAAAGAPDDALVRQAVLSGLAGLEEAALDALLADPALAEPSEARERWLGELAGAAVLAAAGDEARAAALLDRIARVPDADWRKLALASGAAALLRRPGGARLSLAAPHPLFERATGDGELARALRGMRRGVTWPGDPSPLGARPLTSEEEERRAAGAARYAESCAACHGADGRGQPALAPTLAGSPWVLDADGWLIRIALHGVAGPLRVAGEDWDLAMPPHAQLGDAALAEVLTFVRRGFGNGGDPIAPADVAAVRRAHAERATPWTAEELLALDVPHRLDRYVGSYGLPVVRVELRIERRADRLFLGVSGRGGMGELTARSDGTFQTEDPSGGAIVLEFDEDGAGAVTGVTMVRGGGDRIPWRRK